MKKTKLDSVIHLISIVFIICGMVFTYHHPVSAATPLTIETITWNVIGLVGNDVTSGPNRFPVGARVCNLGSAPSGNLQIQFNWDSTNSLINLTTATVNPTSYSSLPAGECMDFYFEVEIDRNSNAFETTRRYHLSVTETGSSPVSTSTPREVYVEKLVSQCRNGVTDIKLSSDGTSYTSIPAGGTLSLAVGGTYYIQMDAYTATGGYEQIEAFLNLPNSFFRIEEVARTYTAPPNLTTDMVYGDACTWDDDPTSPTYRSCLGSGKMGGTMTTIYKVTVLSTASGSYALNGVVYDFSGSSYHVNADFSTNTRTVVIVDPIHAVDMTKSFNPSTIPANGISTMIITLENQTVAILSDLNFSDTFPTTPGAMTIASPLTFSTSGCGSPVFDPALAAGAGGFSISNITLAASGICTIKINMTASATGTYTNTTGHLFIGDTDTGEVATANLTIQALTTPLCIPDMPIATWTFEGQNLLPATNFVGTATASYGSVITNSSFSNNSHSGTSSWETYPHSKSTTRDTNSYLRFQLDTKDFETVNWSLWLDLQNATGPAKADLVWNANSLQTINLSTSWAQSSTNNILTNFSTISDFTIYTYAATAGQAANRSLFTDDVVFTGCGRPKAPTLSKAFSDDVVAVGGSSTLTFTLTNPNPSLPLTNLRFTDILPAGLTVAASTTTACGGTLTTTAPDQIAFSGGTLAGGASCSFPVTVTAASAGVFENVSGYISANYQAGTVTSSITNTTITGYGVDTLKAVAAPAISKSFHLNPIVAGGISTLTFVITNPNLQDVMTGVSFTDNLPSTPGQMVVAPTPGVVTSGCGSPAVTAAAGATSIGFSGGSIEAGGTCIVSVDVTAPTAGTYNNTTGEVSGTVAGQSLTGNTASAALIVDPVVPDIAILKQIATSAFGPWYSYLAVAPGDEVWYRFTIENTGDVPLTSVNVTDETLTNQGVDISSCSGITLSLCDVATCVVGPLVTGENALTNTATAHGTYNSIVNNSEPDTARYEPTGLTLVKSVTETTFALGDSLHYSYLVTNTGTAPLAAPVTITDNKIPGVSCPTLSDGDLDPGESTTCTATYTATVSEVSAGYITNIAYAAAGGVRSNLDLQTVTNREADFGNLPASYKNLYRDGGPWHLKGTTFLGESVIAEADGMDGFVLRSDDDGVGFPGTWSAGGSGSASVAVTCSSSACHLAGWIDWNKDGDFLDDGERLDFASSVTGLTTSVSFSIPSGVILDGSFYARFRLYAGLPDVFSPEQGAATNGTFTVGEVEDYEITYTDGVPTAITGVETPTSSVDTAIHIRWVTTNEFEILGFRLHRSTAESGLHLLIYETPALYTGKLIGAEYTYSDTNIEQNVRYYYWLEVLFRDGSSILMDPLTAWLAEFKLQLPLISK